MAICAWALGCQSFGASDGVEEVVVEGSGQAEAGRQVVDQLGAAEGLIVLAVAAERI
jgi:hypothetical protein